MEKYTLQSGELIDVSTLPEEARKHVSQIEHLIANSADYLEVDRQAFIPLLEGKHFTAQDLEKLHASPHYKIVFDLVERYWQKCFGLF